jgi:hypothetical protein
MSSGIFKHCPLPYKFERFHSAQATPGSNGRPLYTLKNVLETFGYSTTCKKNAPESKHCSLLMLYAPSDQTQYKFSYDEAQSLVESKAKIVVFRVCDFLPVPVVYYVLLRHRNSKLV